MTMDIFLLSLMALAAMWAVMARSLLKGAMGLAITSAILTILIFRLNSPLASVFELSVCTGLITVIFVSTISLTKPLTHKEILAASADRLKRFFMLPILVLLAGAGLMLIKLPKDAVLPQATQTLDVRTIMWGTRQLDLFGQIIIIIAGALGVVILFKEMKKK